VTHDAQLDACGLFPVSLFATLVTRCLLPPMTGCHSDRTDRFLIAR
jgi:hypothetical protein